MARPLIAGASEGVRAALSTFIPLALIVLIAWATAGSLSGQMGDALRSEEHTSELQSLTKSRMPSSA